VNVAQFVHPSLKSNGLYCDVVRVMDGHTCGPRSLLYLMMNEQTELSGRHGLQRCRTSGLTDLAEMSCSHPLGIVYYDTALGVMPLCVEQTNTCI
jgi:hypothetical protein